MYDIGLSKPGKKYIDIKSLSPDLLDMKIDFRGFSEDIVESYYWHLNFAYFVGKGYKAIKVEDHHYFSESSQFGQNIRQIKGGSIRAFQENLQQMIQLVKVHMMPLLKELKQAEFYKEWIDKIVLNDDIVQDLKSKGVSNSDTRMAKARRERNEALNHIKDKWVNEVDGGRMWQMNRSATEQGLDYALLPQLFFSINLDNPLVGLNNKGPTITEQLDTDIYPVDITENAKEQVARFMYRFYIWLPTAIKETQTTFSIKIAALKQFYSQLMMYANFMKPLLLEISRKSESLEKENFYNEFTQDNPDFVNMLDYSYSFVKLLCVRNLERHGYQLNELEFTQKGFFIKAKDGNGNTILSGRFQGKSGFIIGTDKKGGKAVYEFIECPNKDIEIENYRLLLEKWVKNKTYIFKDELKTFPIILLDFLQKRRNQIMQTQQGPQSIPFLHNVIGYKAYAWNLYEIACLRENLKDESLDLLAGFIEEINVIKEDLKRYASMVRGYEDIQRPKESESEYSNSNKKNNDGFSLLLGPFQGFGELLSPLLPNLNFGKDKYEKQQINSSKDNSHLVAKLQAVEDTWKLYSVHKKVKRFMQYM